MSEFIPNSYQTPNAYCDRFMHLLTPEEWKVLSYLARRIFGFNKREDRISLPQFSQGIVTREGKRLDHGTGLNVAAIRRALEALIKYRLVIEVEPPNFGRRIATCYALQMDSDEVDLDGLELRSMESQHRNTNRTASATIEREVRRIRERGTSDDMR